MKNKLSLSYKDACNGQSITYWKWDEGIDENDYTLEFDPKEGYPKLEIKKSQLLSIYNNLDNIYFTNLPHKRWLKVNNVYFYKEYNDIILSEKIYISLDKNSEYLLFRSELMDIIINMLNGDKND